MRTRTQTWLPRAGTFATYAGGTRSASRTVRIIAEAAAGHMVVEAIGRRGHPVRITVKRESIVPLQPSLFDGP